MKKLGRKGMIKNWKKRFFVLNAGVITYYEKEINEFPFGDSLKGELNLANTEVIEENKKYNEKQIFIVSFNGEYNLLMETESADDADDWIIEIRDHIKYANAAAEEPESSEAMKARAAKAQSMKVPARQLSDDESESFSSSSGAVAPAATVSTSSPSVAVHKAVRPAAAQEASAPAANNKHSAIALAIEAEKIDFSTFCEKLPDYLQGQVAKLQVDESRTKFLSDLISGVQTVLTSLVANTGGEFGTRGESYMGIILVLACSIIIGLHSVLEMLIRFLIRVSGSLYVAVGIAMIIAGLFELKSNASLFYLPIERNKLVTSGIFRFVRHPVYGGLLLLCIGLSITSQRWDKMVLSVVLGVVLDQVSDLEEGALLLEHPLAYRAFIGSRKKFVPFLC